MTTSLSTTANTRGLLAKMAPEFKKALSGAISPEKFCRVALTACQKTPKLLDCTPESFLGALMVSAQMGLEPDGVHAALIPFGTTATLIPMVRGIVRLMHNHPLVRDIECAVVREADEFRFTRGTEKTVHHVPSWPTSKAGDMIAVYAIAHLTNGGLEVAVMDRDEVLLVKAKSRGASKPDSPWSVPAFEPRMWEKTALKRLAKLVPSSERLTMAVGMDDAAEIGTQEMILPRIDIDATVMATDDAVAGLIDRLDACESDLQVGQVTQDFNAMATTAPQQQQFSAAAKNARAKTSVGSDKAS